MLGTSEAIKERSIGVEVFGRSPDYDTNTDPIVRNAASEVRKRLALYQTMHSHPGLVEITLPHGTYVPEFLFAAHLGLESSPNSERFECPPQTIASGNEISTGILQTIVPTEHAISEDHPASLISESKQRSIKIFWWIVPLGLAVTAACIWTFSSRSQKNPMEDFWGPFFRSTNGEALVVIPEAPAPPAQSTSSNWVRDNPNIAIEDAFAVTRVSGLLMEHDVHYRVKMSSVVTLGDMIDKPIILIGGPSNQWTTKFLAPLRYRFNGAVIEDVENPTVKRWFYDNSGPGHAVLRDCAIVARFHNQPTGSPVVVIAGAGRSGTEAAGEFVSSPMLLSALDKMLPPHWQNQNLEVILSTNVMNGKPSEPEIEATYMW